MPMRSSLTCNCSTYVWSTSHTNSPLGTIPSTLIPFTAPFPLPPEMANLSCTPYSSAFRCPEGGCSPNCRNSIRHFKAIIPLLPRPSHEDTTSQTIFLAPAFIPPNTPIQILYGGLFTPGSHPPSAEHPQYHYSLPFGTTLSTASRSSVPRLLRRSPNPNCSISLLPVRLSSNMAHHACLMLTSLRPIYTYKELTIPRPSSLPITPLPNIPIPQQQVIDDSPDIIQTRALHRSSADENISADHPAPRDQSTPQQSTPIPLCPAFPAHKKITVAKHTRLVKPQPHRKPKTKQATESIPHAHHKIWRFCLVPTPIATNNDPVSTTAPSPSPQHHDELMEN